MSTTVELKSSKELAELLAVRSRELKEFIDETQKKGVTAETIQETIRRDAELNEIEDQRVKALEYEGVQKKNAERFRMLNEPVDTVGHAGSGKPEAEQKSLGEMFTSSPAYKNRTTVHDIAVDFENYQYKTTMTTAAGWAPPNPRTNIVIPLAQRRPVVADLIPQDPTTNSSVKYMEETTNTNNAAVVAEGAAKPESALAFTERTSNVIKIATWIPVTEEQLEDVPQAQAVVNNRLQLMLQLAEETELLTGDGTGAHLDGFLHRSGTQTQALGADPVPTAVYKAITLARFTGFAEPDGIIMHPNDWVDIATLQDGMGRYVWGNPYDMGPVERLWGKPVVVTPAETQNTALVGDFSMYSHISRRTGVSLRVFDQHASNAVSNILVILIEERLSLEIYRPAAFVKVTGI